jgi:Ni,Fe-hydrogenase I large subunit
MNQFINSVLQLFRGYPVFISLILLFGLSACKSKRILEEKEITTAENLKQILIKNQVRASWMDAKVKVNYNDGYLSQGATAHVRMAKDSLVWISVRKLGLEVVRLQVTQDSVYFVDRFNQQYAVADLNFLSKMYSLPASLSSFQALLLGNPIFLSSGNLTFKEDENYYYLMASGQRSNSFWLDKQSKRLSKIDLEDESKKQAVEMSFDNYKPLIDKQLFSHSRKINLLSPEIGKVQIDIEFTSIELNQPKEIRFEIPKHYKRMEQ